MSTYIQIVQIDLFSSEQSVSNAEANPQKALIEHRTYVDVQFTMTGS